MVLPACHHCASPRIRRVRAAGPVQRLIRGATPLRRYLCLDCGHRGWATGRIPWEDVAPTRPVHTARPLEPRDLAEASRRRLRFLASLALAVGAGALVALLVSGVLGH
jgi:hypothetical protein